MQERWSPSIRECYDSYILDLKSRQFSQTTLDTAKYRLAAFFDFLSEQQITYLSGITANHIREFYIKLQDRGLASHTVHGHARAVKAWLNWCVNEELLSESPMKRVKMPKLAILQKPYLSVEDVSKLLQLADDREASIVLVLVDTGLRATELCSLDGGDINITNGAIRVRAGKGEKDRTAFLGGKSRRQLMKLWRNAGRPGEKDPVWVTQRGGKRLTRSGLRQILVRLGKRAGVANTNPHALRRTFATWAWQGGMDLKSLQHLMGHSDLDVLKNYLGISDEDLRNAHEKHGPVDGNL